MEELCLISSDSPNSSGIIGEDSALLLAKGGCKKMGANNSGNVNQRKIFIS